MAFNSQQQPINQVAFFFFYLSRCDRGLTALTDRICFFLHCALKFCFVTGGCTLCKMYIFSCSFVMCWNMFCLRRVKWYFQATHCLCNNNPPFLRIQRDQGLLKQYQYVFKYHKKKLLCSEETAKKHQEELFPSVFHPCCVNRTQT